MPRSEKPALRIDQDDLRELTTRFDPEELLLAGIIGSLICVPRERLKESFCLMVDSLDAGCVVLPRFSVKNPACEEIAAALEKSINEKIAMLVLGGGEDEDGSV